MNSSALSRLCHGLLGWLTDPLYQWSMKESFFGVLTGSLPSLPIWMKAGLFEAGSTHISPPGGANLQPASKRARGCDSNPQNRNTQQRLSVHSPTYDFTFPAEWLLAQSPP